LRDVTVALAVVAIGPGWNTVVPPLLASVPFLLLIRSRPTERWLYPAVGLVLASATFAVFGRLGFEGLAPGAIVAAFACWCLGMVLARWTPRMCARLGLPISLRLESPAYHVAMFLGVVVIALRLGAVVLRGEPWSSSPWAPAALAVLALLMVKPYPVRDWVDGFAGLMTLAAVLTCGPFLGTATAWGLLAMALALVWRTGAWGASRSEDRVCRLLAISYRGTPCVLGQWSIGLLALGVVPTAFHVGGAVLSATFGLPDLGALTASQDWWTGLAAILLLGLNLELTYRADFGEGAWLGRHPAITLLLWWLACATSPFVAAVGLDPASMLPLVTAAQAVVAAALAVRSASQPLAQYGLGLSLVATALTAGRIGTATTATLLLATVVQGRVAVSFRWRGGAIAASVLVALALRCGSEQLAREFGWDRSPIHSTVVAMGQVIAALALVVAGGWDRRRSLGFARIFEGFAAATLAMAAGAVGLAIIEPFGPIGPDLALSNVGILWAVASLCVILAARWSSMPMAFAAQAVILLGYAAYRAGFAVTPMGDSSAMLVLAGIDLGIAEVAGRARRRVFALPALSAGLVLPLIAVMLALGSGRIGEEPLFVLFASGTFYAATCVRLRWKMLGYAAAVLYNAALWVLWARFGWKIAEAPQFYLVPVGFSTILFAEANRRELGRPRVNAIRGAGLTLIYLALAVPIWETASLAAWAAVLGVSLLGIIAGIGLQSRAFLWLGLAGFLLDVVYQLGRIGMEHALAKWAIMLALGLALVLFVALNEKKRIVLTIRKCVDVVRQWE
jgi:hypothetical protein